MAWCACRPPSLDLPEPKQPRLQEAQPGSSAAAEPPQPAGPHDQRGMQQSPSDVQQQQLQQQPEEGTGPSVPGPGTYWQDPVSSRASGNPCLTPSSVPLTLAAILRRCSLGAAC